MEYVALCALLVIGFLVACINESIGKIERHIKVTEAILSEILKRSERNENKNN
jgi:hypothetical protein